MLTACTDNDSFSNSAGNRLTFSEDTVRFDTLFSTVPSSTQTFWVRNESNDGIRIVTARLERSNQSGYRVNVDGTYLDPVGSDFEVRKGDSLLVFVEVTTRENHADEPQLVEDNLIFQLESGVQQRVNLRTFSWDAIRLDSLVVRQDTMIETSRPVVIYGDGYSLAELKDFEEKAVVARSNTISPVSSSSNIGSSSMSLHRLLLERPVNESLLAFISRSLPLNIALSTIYTRNAIRVKSIPEELVFT